MLWKKNYSKKIRQTFIFYLLFKTKLYLKTYIYHLQLQPIIENCAKCIIKHVIKWNFTFTTFFSHYYYYKVQRNINLFLIQLLTYIHSSSYHIRINRIKYLKIINV